MSVPLLLLGRRLAAATARPAHWLCQRSLPYSGGALTHCAGGRRPYSSETPEVLDVSSFRPEMIRNFSIIAHIDHGKSTLADRLLEITGTVIPQGQAQVLDRLQVEKERGITVKAQTAALFHTGEDGKRYLLNLIDTPGHVDFNYEVACSLAACQGTLLVVDASQGVQAQTLANFFLAFEKDVKIVPVVNKVDLPTAHVDNALKQMESLFDLDPKDAILVSAKTGLNIQALLSAIIERIPPPQASPDKPLRALLFDSWYDDYRGVVSLVEITDGMLKPGDRIVAAHSNQSYEVQEVGLLRPHKVKATALHAGQVGYVICGMKRREEARVGDTIFHKNRPVTPLPGFRPAKPMVFAGMYPISQDDYEGIASALEKLVLNDASVSIKRDVSAALGPGWRIGYLGLLHMEVFSQRMEQEHGLSVLITSPSVSYKATFADGSELIIDSPDKFPASRTYESLQEPMVQGTLLFPDTYMGGMIGLCESRRGRRMEMKYIDDSRVLLKYRLPLSEIIEDFYDELKSISSGYATFDYEDDGYEDAPLTKLEIMLNGEVLDALSFVVHNSRAHARGKKICESLKETIPRQLYDVAIQASAHGRVIARETVKALRKDVTAKCYGGDITRKMKLLARQKEGKKKMKMFGNIELPKEAFLTVLKRE